MASKAPLSVGCALSLAKDAASFICFGRDCPPSLQAELDEADRRAQLLIEFFFLGANWHKEEGPEIAEAHMAPKHELRPTESVKAAPDCWERAARAELRARQTITLAAIIATAALTLLAFQVSLNNARVADEVRQERTAP